MCRPCIGTGLHAITRQEIYYAARPKHQSREDFKPHKGDFPWPENLSNASLRDSLCVGCNVDVCEIKCGYGREAQLRVDTGRMAPCMGLRQRREAAF